MNRDKLIYIAEQIIEIIGCEMFLKEILLGLDIDELQIQLEYIDRYYNLDLFETINKKGVKDV